MKVVRQRRRAQLVAGAVAAAFVFSAAVPLAQAQIVRGNSPASFGAVVGPISLKLYNDTSLNSGNVISELRDGQVIDVASLQSPNILAVPGQRVASVRFCLDRGPCRVETNGAFEMHDVQSPQKWSPAPGRHSLDVLGYASEDASGSAIERTFITFFVGSREAAIDTPSPKRVIFGARPPAAGSTSPSTSPSTSRPARPESNSGEILFADGFESGNLDAWQSQSCNDESNIVYSAQDHPEWPAPPEGRYAVRLLTLNSDVEPCTPTDSPRSQILTADILEEGTEVWQAWSTYVPGDFEMEERGVMFQQDHGPPYTTSPPVAFRVNSDKIWINTVSIKRDYSIWETPLKRNRWYRFLVRKKLERDESGEIELWVDGVQQTFVNGSTTMNIPTAELDGTGPMAFYLNNYRGDDVESTTLFFDDARVGSSRAAVE